METLTVAELRKLLDGKPDDAKVAFTYPAFTYPAGDYWRTTLVGPINRAEFKEAEYTGYHSGYRLSDDKDEDDGKKTEETVEVLVLG